MPTITSSTPLLTTTTANEQQCTILISRPNNQENNDVNSETLQKQLETLKDSEKISAMKEIIIMMLNGDSLPRLLMPVIKFCMRSNNHKVKKLVYLYLEIVQKRNLVEGTLLPEMILVCNALLHDLQHPNEFLRGATLRLLCKLKETEILETLKQAILENLNHKHFYVRKNTVLAIFSIFQRFPQIIPNSCDIIYDLLQKESDLSVKRNAFLMLFNCNQNLAISYLSHQIGSIHDSDNSFQMIVLELIRKVCRQGVNYQDLLHYQKCVYQLLYSSSKTIAFEAANTILTISSLAHSSTIEKASINTMTDILRSESDNNIKIIILNRLLCLKKKHERVLENSIMDILKCLSSSNFEIRKKILELSLELICSRNIDDVINFLKKEILKTKTSNDTHKNEYQSLLVETIHKCAVKFPKTASNVVHLLINYLGEDNPNSARDVIYFVREIVESYPDLRDLIVSKLIENFDQIDKPDIFRTALWILGEYAIEPYILKQALQTLIENVGKLPLLGHFVQNNNFIDDKMIKNDIKNTSSSSTQGPVILPDGTYASQGPVSLDSDKQDINGVKNDYGSLLRKFLLKGNFFLATSLANAFTKLVLRFASLYDFKGEESNKQIAEGLFLLTSILRLGKSQLIKHPIDEDSFDRIILCIQTLLHPEPLKTVFLEECHKSFSEMLKSSNITRDQSIISNQNQFQTTRHVDEFIQIRQLHRHFNDANKNYSQYYESEDEDDFDNLTRAVGKNSESEFSNRLKNIKQLTGLSDPVYCEACVSVHEFDIVLDILLINRTEQTLENLTVELYTHGDLKIIEKPQSYTFLPDEIKHIQTIIKVSSTESAIIFGNIVFYFTGSRVDPEIVVLNSIHMDVGDYISPYECNNGDFTQMWAEFEWENKVPIYTDIQDLIEYLQHIISITHMKCLTPENSLKGKSGFLAANLYAKSIFGEAALLNLSIEYTKKGKISGYIRIRSKMQGIARSLGDKIQSQQCCKAF